jgi:hypothetical protein
VSLSLTSHRVIEGAPPCATVVGVSAGSVIRLAAARLAVKAAPPRATVVGPSAGSTTGRTSAGPDVDSRLDLHGGQVDRARTP